MKSMHSSPCSVIVTMTTMCHVGQDEFMASYLTFNTFSGGSRISEWGGGKPPRKAATFYLINFSRKLHECAPTPPLQIRH